MVVAAIASSGAIAARGPIEPRGLSNQHASWSRVIATIGPSTKFEALPSAPTPSTLQSSEFVVLRIPLSLARMS